MPVRAYWIPAVILWFASTGWLISTKILPSLSSGNAPDYGEMLPPTPVSDPDPVRWTIRWNGHDIGWAENKITRSIDGTGQIVSEVQFRQLPVQQMVGDVMGILGRFATQVAGDIGPIDLRVLTNMQFDNYGVLDRFQTSVDVGPDEDLFQIEGQIIDDKLDLAARIQDASGEPKQIYRNRQIPLPPDALVADTFSPRPKLGNLRVGQSWTFQSYQPLMPYNPLSLIEATVEREEFIDWNGRMTRVRKVSFRRDAGSGISSTRRPISEAWVMYDGTVVRQDIMLANVKVQFIRSRDVKLSRDLGKVGTATRATLSTEL